MARSAVLLAALLAPLAAHAAAAVVDIRSGLHPDKTRVVVELTEPVAYQLFTLADPYRVVVDLPELDWRVKPRADVARGLVGNLRYGVFRPGTSRIVLDATGPVIAKALLLPPGKGGNHRLVLDLSPTDRTAFLAGVKPPKPPPVVELPPAGPRRDDGKRVLVIDAGHGGVDPGAIGIDGYHEKDLVLAYALALRDALHATGRYEVVLTRDRDVFLPLRERVAAARHAQADLFISLHADSLRDRSVGGGAVYTLSETASDDEAADLAARENKSDLIAGVALDVQDDEVATILIDLAQREAMNYAARFAQTLVKQIGPVRQLRKRPHRFAGFRVLKAPDVPSVLLELGFMSNSDDARFLRDVAGRRAVVGAVVRAIDQYFTDPKI
ncbi:MAG: N-acetylmuramoyl-L-alanine amidase [Alphaproteobacteria bacterium]